MSKHTPGPWGYMDAGAQVFAENGQRHIADVRGYGALSVEMGGKAACERMDADGLLIAAAPEMYDALDWLVHIAHNVGKDGTQPTAEELRDAVDAGMAALAKARGK